MVDVSVLILNFNTFDLTCACIQSVYNHTKQVTFEIILVDNGSTECHPNLFKEKFSDIILVESDTNLGFAKGNNLGLRYATGMMVLLLNSDTELLNDSISIGFQRLAKSKGIGALTGKVITPAGEVQHVAQRFPSISLLLLQVLRLFHFMPSPKRAEAFLGEYFSYDREIYADWIWATFFLIRREAISTFRGGKFPEDFFMYEEDKLWGYYLRKKGYDLLFTPLPLILHHVSGSSKESSDIVTAHTPILRNEFLVIAMTKGKWYAKAYFALKTVHYLTSRYTFAKPLSKLYLSIALSPPRTVNAIKLNIKHH
ncbi:glycosyltransferase family 2 protein [Pontibacter sp. CAU 1760]